MLSRQGDATPRSGGARVMFAVRDVSVVCLLGVGSLSLAGCVADPPPLMGTAVAGSGQATVSWSPPLGNSTVLVGYVITPHVNRVAQTPVGFDSTATTRVVTGLTNGTTYTFTVVGINAVGGQTASSAESNPVTPSVPPVAAVSAGSDHTCALLVGGTARCWGAGYFGKLGNGGTADSAFPVPVAGIEDATALAAGGTQTCALISDGSIRCWGGNFDGQLGNGTTTGSMTPVVVTGISDAIAVTSGEGFVCALIAGGSIECWGGNDRGQLGIGTFTRSSVPVEVTGIADAIAVDAGGSHACALLVDGAVRCWGASEWGQLGYWEFNQHEFPTPVPAGDITDATTITAGGDHTCALRETGGVWCWGQGSNGELGDGVLDESNWSHLPLPMYGITDASVVVAGWLNTCVIDPDGMSCTGANAEGQLGNGTTTASAVAVPVSNLTEPTAMTLGVAHACALMPDATLKCWGDNNRGQLGIGIFSNRSTLPTAVAGL
jgi:alpha-tubulin suppressor-like RCC1 family protein